MRMRLIAAAIGAYLVTSGCGGVELGGADPALTTLGFGLPDEIATTRVDLFRKANPDVPLEITEGRFDEQQFLSAVAVRKPPDIVYLDRSKIGTYASREALQPIDWCVREQGVDLGAFREAAIREVTTGGKLYALPDFNNVRVVIVNNAALRDAGLDPASLRTGDWPALAAAATRMTSRTGDKVARIGFDPKIPEMLPLWAKAAGADLVDGQGRPRLDAPEVVRALEFTSSMVRQQAPWPSFKGLRDTFDLFGAKNPYVANQLGGMIIETWFLNVLARTTPDADFTVLPFTDQRGQPLTWATGLGWGISKNARHPKQACEFIAHMTRAETWVAALTARKAALQAKKQVFTGSFTGNRIADERIFRELYEPVPQPHVEQGVRVALAAQEQSFFAPPTPVGSEIITAYEAATTRVLLGQQNPRQSLAQAQREALQALEWR